MTTGSSAARGLHRAITSALTAVAAARHGVVYLIMGRPASFRTGVEGDEAAVATHARIIPEVGLPAAGVTEEDQPSVGTGSGRGVPGVLLHAHQHRLGHEVGMAVRVPPL